MWGSVMPIKPHFHGYFTFGILFLCEKSDGKDWHKRVFLMGDYISCGIETLNVATLAVGSQPKQGVARLRAKRKT
jgi:hypothetical protein